MSKQSRTTETKVDKKPSSPAKGQTLTETLDAPAALAEFPIGWSSAPNQPTIGGQADRLESRKFHTVQRQQMARQIGAFHGNHHLQRLAASSKNRPVFAPYQPNKESATLDQAQRAAGKADPNARTVTLKAPFESPTTNLVSRWSFPGLDTLKEKAAEFAQDFPGYPLLTFVLGRDPIADKPVTRNATNLIQGLLSLVPGGDKMFANLQKSGAIEQAYAWVQNQIAKLNLTWNKIKGLVKKAVSRLEIGDVLNPLKAIRTKVFPVFRPLITRLKNFAVAAGQKILEFIFEGALTLAGPFASKILGVVKRAGGVFNKIIKDPIGFVGNLVKAVQKGFSQFSKNILTHLKSGLMGWLFGTLSKAGLQMPQKLDLQGLLSIVLQVLGLTYNVLRRKLVGMLGEERVAKLEQVFEFIKTLATEGLAAAWQQLLSYIGSLKDMVIGAIREWVVTKIVTSAITKLVSMFNPAGAVIQAIMAIYNTIKFFIERADQLAELANAVFGSIGSIAAGSIGAAAGYIEKTMGRAIPIMLGFLARLIGLGGVGGKIKNIIRGIQAKISKAIDRFISFIRQKARKLFRRGGKAKEEPNNVSEKDRQAGLAAFEKEEKKYIKDGGITREDAKKTAASVKKKYPVFKSVSVVDGKDSWDYQYVFRAKVDTPTEKAEINISEADIAKTVDEAIRARGTAIADLQKRRGQEKGKKTVACVGTKCFMSGWTEERPEAHLATMTVLFEEGKEKERMIRESGSSVKEHAEKFTDTKKKPKVEGLEYQTRGSGYLDKGVSGRYVASHAEKQAAQWAPNQPIGVTRGMCGDCQRYFKSLAKRTKRLQVVADPNVVRIFHTDGTVETR